MSQGSSNNCWRVMRSVTAICLQTPTGSGLYLFLIGSAFYSQTPLVVVLLHKMSVEIYFFPLSLSSKCMGFYQPELYLIGTG